MHLKLTLDSCICVAGQFPRECNTINYAKWRKILRLWHADGTWRACSVQKSIIMKNQEVLFYEKVKSIDQTKQAVLYSWSINPYLIGVMVRDQTIILRPFPEFSISCSPNFFLLSKNIEIKISNKKGLYIIY